MNILQFPENNAIEEVDLVKNTKLNSIIYNEAQEQPTAFILGKLSFYLLTITALYNFLVFII